MPRTHDLPCAGCGKMMWRTPDSLPEGRATCHPCRRRAWGLAPNEKVIAHSRARGTTLAAKRLPECLHCAGPIDPDSRRWKYCSHECFNADRAKRGFGAISKPPSKSRGYGRPHQRLRAKLLPLAYGTPCHLCGEVMEEGQRLHLDHNEDRTGYRGMAHASCNVRDGARRAGQLQRQRRLETGWRPGQDPSARRRPASTGARRGPQEAARGAA